MEEGRVTFNNRLDLEILIYSLIPTSFDPTEKKKKQNYKKKKTTLENS